jgi:hypothetical protein
MHVIALHCGEKGLAVCAVSTDPNIRLKEQRRFVVHGFELVSDAAYLGINSQAALPGMLQRSQLLQTVLAHNPQTHVVSNLEAVSPTVGAM